MLTQISAAGEVEVDAFAEVDGDDDPEPAFPPPGVIVGVGPGGVLGAEGSTWHRFPELLTDAWELAKAAAVVPAHTTATPANTANTDDPARFPRWGVPALSPSLGMILRFSIIG
ncbi:MAG: hypothetical protein ACRDNF_09240 [Streptosporangiaceae bacterium]